MPLYDSYSYQMARDNLVSKDVSKPCATHQSSTPEKDFFELVWENGQISTQGQSSRARRSPTSRSSPPHTHSAKTLDKEVRNASDTQIRKFSYLDSGLNEIPMSVPTGEVDLSPDEGMTSWLNYSVDDFLQHDYHSEFLHELSGDTMNEIPASDNCYPRDKRHNCNNREFWDSPRNPAREVSSSEQGIVSRGFSVGEGEAIRTKADTNEVYLPSSQQCQASLTCIRSRASDITETNPCSATQHSRSREITEVPSTCGGFSSLKIHKHDPVTPGTSSTSTIINFSHFARPAAMLRSNLQSRDMMSGLSLARPESVQHMDKHAAVTRSNPPESTSNVSGSEHPRESNMPCQQELGSFKSDLKMLELESIKQKGVASEQLDHACKHDNFKDDQTSDQVLAESGTKGHAAVENSSSVCSGNGVEMFSDNSNQNLKRKKSQDTEGSECHSEDVEEESGFGRKAARGGSGSKRSRAAEVHNLSERRRRDRINEKMRALQELIPNCNKVDKASMLDEAIEYLKTLQLQVQMMSMGAGLYAPPMMLPHGMQHMHSAVSAFPHMGGCMPLGLGMGFPMIQMPQMQGTHLPVPSMFGVCGQGFPIPMPRPPLMNSKVMQGSGGSNPAREMSTQCEATNGGLEESAFAHDAPDVDH